MASQQVISLPSCTYLLSRLHILEREFVYSNTWEMWAFELHIYSFIYIWVGYLRFPSWCCRFDNVLSWKFSQFFSLSVCHWTFFLFKTKVLPPPDRGWTHAIVFEICIKKNKFLTIVKIKNCIKYFYLCNCLYGFPTKRYNFRIRMSILNRWSILLAPRGQVSPLQSYFRKRNYLQHNDSKRFSLPLYVSRKPNK